MTKISAVKSPSIYGVHPGVAMVEKWVAELKEKSGRSLEEWIALVKKEAPKGEKERREWLKTEHKLGTNSARWIAARADGKGGEEETPEAYFKAAVGYVEEQYAGPKEKLRPIYEKLLALGKSVGGDVKVARAKRSCRYIGTTCSRRLNLQRILGSIWDLRWLRSRGSFQSV